MANHAKLGTWKGRHLIGGEWRRSGQATFENINPADTRQVLGVYPRDGVRR